jgi:SpoIIAA-like
MHLWAADGCAGLVGANGRSIREPPSRTVRMPQPTGSVASPSPIVRWSSCRAPGNAGTAVSTPLGHCSSCPGDLSAAGTTLRQPAATPVLQRVLVVVDSIGLADPRGLWEDLKLAPLITRMRWVALVTDIEWYARLSEFTGALWPGLDIKHFEPADAASARTWLADQSDD